MCFMSRIVISSCDGFNPCIETLVLIAPVSLAALPQGKSANSSSLMFALCHGENGGRKIENYSPQTEETRITIPSCDVCTNIAETIDK